MRAPAAYQPPIVSGSTNDVIQVEHQGQRFLSSSPVPHGRLQAQAQRSSSLAPPLRWQVEAQSWPPPPPSQQPSTGSDPFPLSQVFQAQQHHQPYTYFPGREHPYAYAYAFVDVDQAAGYQYFQPTATGSHPTTGHSVLASIQHDALPPHSYTPFSSKRHLQSRPDRPPIPIRSTPPSIDSGIQLLSREPYPSSSSSPPHPDSSSGPNPQPASTLPRTSTQDPPTGTIDPSRVMWNPVSREKGVKRAVLGGCGIGDGSWSFREAATEMGWAGRGPGLSLEDGRVGSLSGRGIEKVDIDGAGGVSGSVMSGFLPTSEAYLTNDIITYTERINPVRSPSLSNLLEGPPISSEINIPERRDGTQVDGVQPRSRSQSQSRTPTIHPSAANTNTIWPHRHRSLQEPSPNASGTVAVVAGLGYGPGSGRKAGGGHPPAVIDVDEDASLDMATPIPASRSLHDHAVKAMTTLDPSRGTDRRALWRAGSSSRTETNERPSSSSDPAMEGTGLGESLVFFDGGTGAQSLAKGYGGIDTSDVPSARDGEDQVEGKLVARGTSRGEQVARSNRGGLQSFSLHALPPVQQPPQGSSDGVRNTLALGHDDMALNAPYRNIDGSTPFRINDSPILSGRGTGLGNQTPARSASPGRANGTKSTARAGRAITRSLHNLYPAREQGRRSPDAYMDWEEEESLAGMTARSTPYIPAKVADINELSIRARSPSIAMSRVSFARDHTRSEASDIEGPVPRTKTIVGDIDMDLPAPCSSPTTVSGAMLDGQTLPPPIRHSKSFARVDPFLNRPASQPVKVLVPIPMESLTMAPMERSLAKLPQGQPRRYSVQTLPAVAAVLRGSRFGGAVQAVQGERSQAGRAHAGAGNGQQGHHRAGPASPKPYARSTVNGKFRPIVPRAAGIPHPGQQNDAKDKLPFKPNGGVPGYVRDTFMPPYLLPQHTAYKTALREGRDPGRDPLAYKFFKPDVPYAGLVGQAIWRSFPYYELSVEGIFKKVLELHPFFHTEKHKLYHGVRHVLTRTMALERTKNTDPNERGKGRMWRIRRGYESWFDSDGNYYSGGRKDVEQQPGTTSNPEAGPSQEESSLPPQGSDGTQCSLTGGFPKKGRSEVQAARQPGRTIRVAAPPNESQDETTITMN